MLLLSIEREVPKEPELDLEEELLSCNPRQQIEGAGKAPAHYDAHFQMSPKSDVFMTQLFHILPALVPCPCDTMAVQCLYEESTVH